MKPGLLILVSAPSGAGKTSLVGALLQRDPKLTVCVSHTTRPKRDNEKDGSNYHFVSPEIFERMIDAGDFLEHALVFGNRYGTSTAEVTSKHQAGQDVILEIDWQGAEQIRQLMPEAVSIFILPPSKAALEKRLVERAQDSAQTIMKRLAEAELDMSQARNYDYIIINDDFDLASRELNAVVTAERLKADIQISRNPEVTALLKPANSP